MAALTTQVLAGPVVAGPSFIAASGGGDTLKPGDNARLLVKNGGGAPITVTIPRYPALDTEGIAEAPFAASVPAAGERWIGPLYGSRYMNPATGNVEVTYSGVASVTVAAVNVA